MQVHHVAPLMTAACAARIPQEALSVILSAIESVWNILLTGTAGDGVPPVMSTGAVSSMCSTLAVEISNSGAAPKAETKLDGSTAITVPAAMPEDASTGPSNFGPAMSLSVAACTALVTSTGFAAAPAANRAATSALVSALSEVSPGPGG